MAKTLIKLLLNCWLQKKLSDCIINCCKYEWNIIMFAVAPPTGSVDRNMDVPSGADDEGVAPPTGSVDRNDRDLKQNFILPVAPPTGSVDRNGGHVMF